MLRQALIYNSATTCTQVAYTWIDSDHSHYIMTAALQIYMQGFTNTTADFPRDPNHYSGYPILIGTLPDPQLHRMISRLTVPLEELRVSTKNCQLAKQRPVRGAELDPTRRKVEVRMWHPIWAGSAAETRRIRSIPRIGGVPKRNKTCTILCCLLSAPIIVPRT